jgi:hypothetical protein
VIILLKIHLITVFAIIILIINSNLSNVSAICDTATNGRSLCVGADFSASLDKTNSLGTYSKIVISGPQDKVLSVKVIDSTLLQKFSDKVQMGSNGKAVYAFDISSYSYGKYQAQVSDGISIIKLDFSVGRPAENTMPSIPDKAILLIYTNVSWKAIILTSSNSILFTGNTDSQYSFICNKNDSYDITVSSPSSTGIGMGIWTVANLIQNNQMLNVGVNHLANGKIILSGKCHVAQIPLSNNGMVSFTTDKTVYQYNEPIQISGYILPDLQRNYVLKSSIINSNGEVLKVDSTAFGTLNTFYFNINTHGGLWKPGKYKIVIEIANSKAEKDIVINTVEQKRIDMFAANHIPVWIRGTAKNWSDGNLTDAEFMNSVQYLIQQGIMKVPYSYSPAISTKSLLSWIKTSASMWSDGKLSDDDFINALKYLNFR